MSGDRSAVAGRRWSGLDWSIGLVQGLLIGGGLVAIWAMATGWLPH